MKIKNHLLVGTRKGLVIYQQKADEWKYNKLHFMGIPETLAYVDERNGTWWACLDHGHWGVKMHRSKDNGKTWEELEAPKYPKSAKLKNGKPATLQYIWAFTHAGNDRPNEYWLGTIPGGLFKSINGGKNFQLVKSLWNHHSRKEHWFGGGFDEPGIHSIIVDPKDSDHVYIGISCAGVFETKDGGYSWVSRNKGLKANFLPNPDSEYGQDPHMVVTNQVNPKVMWQQNHCGVFRSKNAGRNWKEVSDKNGLANFGFAIVVDEKNSDRAWVIPAISDVIRIPENQKLCVCSTDDGGKTWKTFRKGLPQKAGFDIVYRHALDVTGNTLAFGTTCGNLFLSENGGRNWEAINNYLPMIYSVHFANS